MNIAEIESDLQELVDKEFEPEEFVFRFLEIYNAPKATLTKLKQGNSNYSKVTGDLLWKNRFFFRVAEVGKAAETVDTMLLEPTVKKHNPRFVLATDGEEFYCRDTKLGQPIDGAYKRLNDQFLFFLPLANIERYELPEENPADIQATGRIAKLYDAILEANRDWIERDYTHDLNQFMTRLLFCFFAEDTSIFQKNIFTTTVINQTQEDGSDTQSVLETIFKSMTTKPEERKSFPDYSKKFPYVNGGLFKDETKVPKFSKRARRLLKECGELYWKEINPDIFGSMIQAVVQPGLRGDMGMHYTSVPNIMKVLQPLFLISLEQEYDSAKDSEVKLKKLLQRIYSIRVFDPACGSGNFLIIAYKELRKLEMKIFEQQKKIAKQWSLPMTGIGLTQFHGIEITDFAAETAKLSLWIAEYQMNELFKSMFGDAPPALPLTESGAIFTGNAATENWLDVCPRDLEYETYVCGNPPYIWSGDQSKAQKQELKDCFSEKLKKCGTLNYVTIWLYKGAKFCIDSKAKCAFVSTNTICQGDQAGILWPVIFDAGVEIGFAHQPFKWKNLASNNAGVTCVIIGLQERCSDKKQLYTDGISRLVRNIGPYLIEMDNQVVQKSSKSLFSLPKMIYGNKPVDGGHLLLNTSDKESLLEKYPQAAPLVKRFYGSTEVIHGNERWCLWIPDSELQSALPIPTIRERIEKVRKARLGSTDKGCEKMALRSHQFREMNIARQHSIVLPAVSSEGREVLPCAVLSNEDVISNRCYQILDPDMYIFALMVSRMHYVWADTVGGKLEKRFNYSNTVVYNTFPVPELSNDQRQVLEDYAWQIVSEREAQPGKSLSWLYNPEKMPEGLAKAHQGLDDALEEIYIGRPFSRDSDRLEHLFKLYTAKKSKEAKKKKVA